MIQTLIEKLERVANDPRQSAKTRENARRDAEGYKAALAKKAK